MLQILLLRETDVLEQLRHLCYQGWACSGWGHLTDLDRQKRKDHCSVVPLIAPGHLLSCKMSAVNNQHIITELHRSHQREEKNCH